MKAIRRLAELKGHPVFFYVRDYFYVRDGVKEFKRVEDESEVRYVVHAVKNDLGDTCDNATINATDFMDVRGIERNDLDLVKVVEDLGEEANGQFADLDIIEIPDNVNWEIDNYDGMEHVDEVHRSW
jgi:hypothetical protein